MKNHKTMLLAVGLITLLLAAGVRAAPVAPADALPQATGAGVDSLGGRILDQAATAAVPGMPMPGTSRTLDLLIEMQGQSAGLDFKERARALDRSARALPPSGPTNLRPTTLTPQTAHRPSGLFGSGAAPAVVTKDRAGGDAEWKAAAGRTAVGLATAGGDGGDSARAGANHVREPLGQLPRVIIRWMRDNRVLLVAAAVGLLALLWGTSLALSQRRR